MKNTYNQDNEASLNLFYTMSENIIEHNSV